MDQTIFTVSRNSDGYWQAMILSPNDTIPVVFNGEETSAETVAAVKSRYGESAERVPTARFQREADARLTHTPEMLALLHHTYAGDLRDYWIYGSVLRPMSGIRIENAVILSANGARYNRWTIHDYVAVPAPLAQDVIDHYDFVLVSHP